MYYTIYKITNKLNGKFYIGMHKTNNLDDGYMGSGKLISRAIKKHGIDNFTKQILHVFDNKEDMKLKEAELVTEELCQSNTSYNICPGGHGGWGYVNTNDISVKYHKQSAKTKKLFHTNGGKAAGKISGPKNILKIHEKYSNGVWFGKTHTEESKKKIGLANSKHQAGKNNSQYGTMWITNGNENRKIKKESKIPEGWYKGRGMK